MNRKMVVVTVHVFVGIGPQVPTSYQVTGVNYWDIIKHLIQYGMDPGSLYGLNGEIIQSGEAITVSELNYIIASGPRSTIIVRASTADNPDGFVTDYTVSCRLRGTVQELIRGALAQELCAPRLLWQGLQLDPSRMVGSYNLPHGAVLHGVRTLPFGETFRFT